MPDLILLRHGQSQWNLENRFTGWVDVPLSPKGEAEARAAVRRLIDDGPRHVPREAMLLHREGRAIDLVLVVGEPSRDGEEHGDAAAHVLGGVAQRVRVEVEDVRVAHDEAGHHATARGREDDARLRLVVDEEVRLERILRPDDLVSPRHARMVPRFARGRQPDSRYGTGMTTR